MRKLCITFIAILMYTKTSALWASNSETEYIFSNGNGNGYSGCVDTHLSEILPNTNLSQQEFAAIESSLHVESKGNHALIRFDSIFGDASNQIALGSQIESAILTVFVRSAGTFETGATIHNMLMSWEDSDTWNSLVEGIQADDAEAIMTPVTTIAPPSVGPLQIDVTESVLSWANGQANYGWVFLPTATTAIGWDFYQSEVTDINLHPKLVVTIPEPATLSLLALGGIGFLRRKK